MARPGGSVQLRRAWIPLAALVFISNTLTPSTARSQALPAQLSILPLPMQATPGTGEFILDGGFEMAFAGHTEPRLERAGQRFFDTLKSSTGLRRWPDSAPKLPQFTVTTKAASALVQQLGEDESYRLEVTPTQVSLTAPNPLGVLRGLQTFLQLVHPTPKGFAVTTIVIEDKPRFPWRGLMIDSGRHFIPVDIIRRNLDAMEAVKMNILHWHVSEDQGFRIESKLFPKLTGLGSDGQFYSQDDVRSIIDYARDRGIRVMPEFEMPSHANSLYVGYPELADGKGSYHLKRKFGEKWGRERKPSEDSSMDPTRETTYKFLDSFFGEMAMLFPDAYVHVGGDSEDAVTEWGTNPAIQQYMRAHGYKDATALQVYFTARLQKIVSRHHKTMVGWDEVLQTDTPRDVVIQSWRGLDSLAVAVGRGNRGILSWGYYLDLNEPASRNDPRDRRRGLAFLSRRRGRLLAARAPLDRDWLRRSRDALRAHRGARFRNGALVDARCARRLPGHLVGHAALPRGPRERPDPRGARIARGGVGRRRRGAPRALAAEAARGPPGAVTAARARHTAGIVRA